MIQFVKSIVVSVAILSFASPAIGRLSDSCMVAKSLSKMYLQDKLTAKLKLSSCAATMKRLNAKSYYPEACEFDLKTLESLSHFARSADRDSKIRCKISSELKAGNINLTDIY